MIKIILLALLAGICATEFVLYLSEPGRVLSPRTTPSS